MLNDLAPIAELGYEPLLICVKNSLPVNNLKELIAWLKANPGKASVGVPGVGSTGNLAGHLVSENHRHHIPVRALSRRRARGAGPDGRPDRHDDRAVVEFRGPGAGRHGQGHRGAGQDPHAGMPEVPTTDEAGLPGFYASIWFGMWAPKGTPKDVIEKIDARDRRGFGECQCEGQARQDRPAGRGAANSRRRKRSPPSKKPRPRNGGRSSRRLASRSNKRPVALSISVVFGGLCFADEHPDQYRGGARHGGDGNEAAEPSDALKQEAGDQGAERSGDADWSRRRAPCARLKRPVPAVRSVMTMTVRRR